jgi:hypothetical protein
MNRFLKVFWLGEVDVGNERLRVSIDQRKPGALNLYHQAMTFLKAMQHV